MRNRLSRFFVGRNGFDHLARFCSLVSFILLILSMFTKGVPHLSNIFWTLGLFGLLYCYFRAFSRNIYKRQGENTRYLQLRSKLNHFFSSHRSMWRQRRDFCFFKCPVCKTILRVPKGKGKIRIVCRKCGCAFERKT